MERKFKTCKLISRDFNNYTLYKSIKFGSDIVQSYGCYMYMCGSSVASPICQEGQSENRPDFGLFFPIFPDFWQIFRCQGGHSAPPCPLTGCVTDVWVGCMYGPHLFCVCDYTYCKIRYRVHQNIVLMSLSI